MTSATSGTSEKAKLGAGPGPSPAHVAKTRGRRTTVIVLAAVAVVAVAAVVWAATARLRTDERVAGVDRYIVQPASFMVELREKGELKAASSVDIKSEVEGRATIISIVDEGTFVQEGDLLVELASDQLDDRIQQQELKEASAVTAFEAAKTDLDIQRDRNVSDILKGELKVELKRLELDKYEGTEEVQGVWGQSLRDAEIAIDQAEIMLERRREDHKDSQQLFERDFITETKLSESYIQFRSAEWALEKARQAKVVLETYTHIAELRQRQSDLEEGVKELERIKKNAASEEARKTRNLEGKDKELEITRAQLAKLRDQKEKSRITASAPGFVVYYSESWRWGSDDQIKEGATVHERQVLMQLPDTSQMLVIVRIHEAKTDKIRVGQEVVIEVEGIPGEQFTGKVTKIAVLADTQNRWLNPELKEYETEITLDPTKVSLKPGVTAHARILVQEVTDKLAVPVQSIFTKAGQRYVFRDDGSKIEPVPLHIGAIGTEFAEVADGLAQGDRVLLAFSEDHTRLIPDIPAAARPGAPPRGARVTSQGKPQAADGEGAPRKPKVRKIGQAPGKPGSERPRPSATKASPQPKQES